MNTTGRDNDSNLEPTGYEYETTDTELDETATGLEGDDEAGESPKKSKKVLFIAGGAVAALALSGLYFVFVGGGSPPPAPPPPVQNVDEPSLDESETALADDGFDDMTEEAPFSDPLAYSDEEQAIDPYNRLGPAPIQPNQLDDPFAQPAQPLDEGVISFDPPATPDYAPDYTETTEVYDDGEVVVEEYDEEYVENDFSQPQQQVEDIRSYDAPVSNEIAVDHLAQFRDMLSPLDGRVTALEGKVGTLEKTVARIDNELKNLPSQAPAPRQSRSSSSTSTRSSTPSTTRSSDNIIRVAPPVSRAQIDSSGRVISVTNNPSVSRSVSTPVAKVAAEVTQSTTCNIQAIVPGRVWVKNADGTFQSFGEDDKWNGQDIESIDPNRGVKAGGKWHCM